MVSWILGGSTDGDLFKIEDAQVCKTLDQCVQDSPGQVSNFVAHNKGSHVVDSLMENHPKFTGRARLHAKLHIDLIGSEKSTDYLNQTRQDRHDFYTELLGSELVGEGG